MCACVRALVCKYRRRRDLDVASTLSDLVHVEVHLTISPLFPLPSPVRQGGLSFTSITEEYSALSRARVDGGVAPKRRAISRARVF